MFGLNGKVGMYPRLATLSQPNSQPKSAAGLAADETGPRIPSGDTSGLFSLLSESFGWSQRHSAYRVSVCG